MAAASAVKADSSDNSQSGNQNNLPLKAEQKDASLKQNTLADKQNVAVDNCKAVPDKTDKVDLPGKKFVDAPVPTMNAWTKRSTSVTSASSSETSCASLSSEQKSETDVTAVTSQKSGKAKVAVSQPIKAKADKPIVEKAKSDLNEAKPPENNQKVKPKPIGQDFVAAPPPPVNPWKKPLATSAPVYSEQDPRPAETVSPTFSPLIKETVLSPTVQLDTRKAQAQEVIPSEVVYTKTTTETTNTPALADESWPTLHDVKVTEPNQVVPSKPGKSPKVKLTATVTTVAASSPTPSPVEVPVVTSSGTVSAPAVSIVEDRASNNVTGGIKPAKKKGQVQPQKSSGGDDSSKENQEATTNGDDSNSALKSKKNNKPKWQRMEIDHPKPDRRNRRSRSQGRASSPRREGKPPGDHFNRHAGRKPDGAESQNWRANMVTQSAGPSPNTDSSVTDTGGASTATDGAPQTAPAGAPVKAPRSGASTGYVSNRPRGRGGARGGPLRRDGGRGRVVAQETKSPPFQSVPHITWNQEQVFAGMAADSETIPAVPWSQGFNRVPTLPTLPRVPPVNPAVMLNSNLLLQEQLLNILGHSASLFYEPAPAPPPPLPLPIPTYQFDIETLKHQVEYYFSEDNLVKDLFLRKKMDKQGWVRLELVLSFNKVKELKADYVSLIQAIKISDKLELSQHEDYIRTLNTPEVWPLEEDYKGLPPPPAVQRVAAMSTLHSDAPEFVPGQPFVLRSFVSETSESIPLAILDPPTVQTSGLDSTQINPEEIVLSDVSSSMAPLSPLLSSR